MWRPSDCCGDCGRRSDDAHPPPSEDYHRLMSKLPRPVRSMTVADIQADWQTVLEELRKGGAVLVESDGGEAFLGVLSRDAGVIGEAEIAQLVENGHIPPLEELLAMDDRGELP
jgi:hypothetical protein